MASVVMAVPRDEKAEALRAVLPGANCGACGYSGCDGYAKAMAHEGAKVGLCSPGGAAVAEATANLLGVEGTLEAKTALVHCGGCEEFAARKLRYSGLPSCAAAAQFYGGDLACSYGCLGYGDCRAVCEYGAITVENGLARIDKDKCAACGLCVKACPKRIISIVPGAGEGGGALLQPRQGGAGAQGLHGRVHWVHEMRQSLPQRRRQGGEFSRRHRPGNLHRLRRLRRRMPLPVHLRLRPKRGEGRRDAGGLTGKKSGFYEPE